MTERQDKTYIEVGFDADGKPVCINPHSHFPVSEKAEPSDDENKKASKANAKKKDHGKKTCNTDDASTKSLGDGKTAQRKSEQTDVSDAQEPDPIFFDTLFRQKRRHNKWRIVDSPNLESYVADTHTHLQYLREPALTLARCAIYNVRFICLIVDVAEDGDQPFEDLPFELKDAVSYQERIVAASRLIPEAATKAFSSITDNAEYRPLPKIRIATGVHPHNARLYDEAMEDHLLYQLGDERVAAIGEIGLDYHYDFSPRDAQQRVFRRQIQLAHETGLPVSLHLREAHADALRILEEEGFPQAGVILHCFNLDWETLQPFAEAGCYVALGGPITFKKSDATREAVQHIAHTRLLTETDAPYMAPEPMRGIECTTDHVIFNAERLAEVCGAEPGESRKAFLEQVYENAVTLLDRKPTAWQQAHARHIGEASGPKQAAKGGLQ
ncbi:MAG: TatD family hydrolase [Eggerthellaceae bacterium]|jgi:TatD DNase family protein